MSIRSIKRNILRNKYGYNKSIKNAWRDMQIKKYGYKLWRMLKVACDTKSRSGKAVDVTP